MLNYLWLVIGLTLLLVGGELLVRGAVGLAEKLKIPPLIIGLTIVSFGTSAPELFISVGAVLDGVGGIALGNVVGSNITNVMLVLGLPAMTMAILCDEEGISKNLVIMLAITIIFMGMMAKGSLERSDGLILLGLLCLFLYDQLRAARKARADAVKTTDYHDEVSVIPTSGWVIGGLLVAGIAALPVGAEFTVNAATTIAKSWHVPDEVIGLTILAIGTSLPELSTTLMASIRKSSSVALGNVVGSNIFNIAA
ncbi:MAG: calcium/sodium antiporter, partial [Rhizobiaceae bacterium]|nr:calcium/sodium antiporter [Rhizobiaceae bacterium]